MQNHTKLKVHEARKRLFSTIRWKIYHPGRAPKKYKSDFVCHARYIEDKLKKLKWVKKGECKLYSTDLNVDGYPRIRYSVPGDYILDENGEPKMFAYKRNGRVLMRKKLRDYRPLLHTYLYWKKDCLYKQKNKRRKAKKEISHLCGNRNCGNPRHLHLEEHVKNLSRIGCPKGSSCIHTPSCI